MNKQTNLPLDAKRHATGTSAPNQPRRNARPAAAAHYLAVSRATLWRWCKERPNFPKPRKHGPRVTCWDLNELDAWLDAEQSR